MIRRTLQLSNFLLQLTNDFCRKYQVQLSVGKTKLLMYSRRETDYTKYAKMLSPIHIGETPIPFVNTAEHVGVLRAVSDNLPYIYQRISYHKKALSMGMARKHRANPIASLRAEIVFATPVLYSGMASLLLSRSEIDILAQHVKKKNISKLTQTSLQDTRSSYLLPGWPPTW